jgi:catechol 2,3-dioxygenase
MALSGALRPGLLQLRVLDLQAAKTQYIDRIGLQFVGEDGDGRIYLKAYDEFERHCLVPREADEAGCDFMAFRVASAADLDSFEKRVSDYGYGVDHVPAGEQPGVGRRIGFMLPSGHRIELHADIDMAVRHPPATNPDIWDEEPRGMGAIRLDHALLYGPNIDEVQDFFEKALDFRCAEKVALPDGMLATWLTCGTKAHDIAFVRHTEPGKFHHASFYLEDWSAVGHAADLIARYNISLDIGPTRHGITRGTTIYFFDPSGNRNEVFSGGYTYYPTDPTRIWNEQELGKGIFYYEKAMNERFLTVVT